jgi:hypothetical protein
MNGKGIYGRDEKKLIFFYGFSVRAASWQYELKPGCLCGTFLHYYYLFSQVRCGRRPENV